jgi:hypothetical protein
LIKLATLNATSLYREIEDIPQEAKAIGITTDRISGTIRKNKKIGVHHA